MSAAVRKGRDTFDRTGGLWTVTVLVLAFLILPILVVVYFSFNSSTSLIAFDSWSLRWYGEVLGDDTMIASLGVSAAIALLTAIVSVVIGTMLAFGLQRASRGVAMTGSTLVLLRLISPETATAASLFLLFSQMQIQLNFWTILVGHIVVCLAFVTVVVRSRISSLNREVEDAAQDLGAPRLAALRLVVLPPLWPTLFAAGLLAFVLSFDNFVTTYFTAGTGDQPLPLRIYSMIRFGVSPEVNAAGVVMLVVVIVLLVAALLALRLVQRLRTRSVSKGSE